jgi:hypothetical protein
MTVERSIEERISRWLIEGAAIELPDRVLRATFERTRRTRQRRVSRRLWLLRRRSRGLAVAIGGAVLVAAIGAGIGLLAGEPSTGSTASARPSSPSLSPSPLITPEPKVFTSSAHGYAITLTMEWTVRPDPRPWDGDSAQNPGADAGMDYYITGRPGEWLEVGVVSIGPGTALQAWADGEAPRTRLAGCSVSPPTTRLTVTGGPVVMARASCDHQIVTSAYLVRGSRGILIRSGVIQQAEGPGRPAFDHFVGSLELRGTP